MRPVVSRERQFVSRGDDRCAPTASFPADLRSRVLAMQRTAGNRAVAGLLGRRMLQRSSTDRDIEQQQEDDVESVQHLLNTGTSRLVDEVEPDPGMSTEEEVELIAPEEASVSDAPQTIVMTPPETPVQTPFSFTPFAFTPTPETLSQTPFSFTPLPFSPSPETLSQTPFSFTPLRFSPSPETSSETPFSFTPLPFSPSPETSSRTPFSFTPSFEEVFPPFEFTSSEPFTFGGSHSMEIIPSPTLPTLTFNLPPWITYLEQEGGGLKRPRGWGDNRPRKKQAAGYGFSSHPFAVPLQQPILATWPSRRRVQRTTFAPGKGNKRSGAFTWAGTKAGSSGKTRTTYKAKKYLTSNATTLATGINTHANMTASVGATRGTATEMKVKRWIIVKGTGTAQKVRPAGWDRFQALCGFIDKGHKCVYVQGHLLYERLGGRGNKMANLAPFTASLNKRHQNQVEKPLWEWIGAAKGKQERTADYQVIPSYTGGSKRTKDDAIDYFRDFVDKRNDDALKTLVKLKLLHKKDVKAVKGQPRKAKVNLANAKTTAATWDALCNDIEKEIADYVAAAFPTKIDCYARLYKRASAKSDWDKTQTKHHSLRNYP
jgi:DNA/RNA non-specific endonuclease